MKFYLCDCKEVFRGNQFCYHRTQAKTKGQNHKAVDSLHYCLHCSVLKEDATPPLEFVGSHKQCPSIRIDKQKILKLFENKAELNTVIENIMNDDKTINNKQLEDDLRLSDSDTDDSDFAFAVGDDTSSNNNNNNSSTPIRNDNVEETADNVPVNNKEVGVEENLITKEEFNKLKAENAKLKSYIETLKEEKNKAQMSESRHHKTARDMKDQLTKIKSQKKEIESNLAQAQKFCAQHREDIKKYSDSLNKIKELNNEKKDIELHNEKLIKENIEFKDNMSSIKLKYQSQLDAKIKEVGDITHEYHRLKAQIKNAETLHDVDIHIPLKNNRKCGTPLYYTDPNVTQECFETDTISCLHVNARGRGHIEFRIRNAHRTRIIGKLIMLYVVGSQFQKKNSPFQSHKRKGHAVIIHPQQNRIK